MANGLDHVVHAVRDLDAAAHLYRRLGFTTGARNRHPWGTHNVLVQLPGFFIEMLTVAEPEKLGDDRFSRLFGGYNQSFLERGEGPSLLILESQDASADAAVFAAAVADWRVVTASGSKVKKDPGGRVPALELCENPDILRTVAARAEGRPRLVVGFAAETDDVVANATAKRLRKGADWLVANDVSPKTGIMGGTENAVTLITEAAASLPRPRSSAYAAPCTNGTKTEIHVRR